MALLATQTVTYAGVQEALTAAAGGGDTFTPDRPNMFLVVNNAHTGSWTVTIVTPGTLRGQTIGDTGGSVTNGTRKIFRLTPPEFFTDPATQLGNITYSGVTALTVGVFALDVS